MGIVALAACSANSVDLSKALIECSADDFCPQSQCCSVSTALCSPGARDRDGFCASAEAPGQEGEGEREGPVPGEGEAPVPDQPSGEGEGEGAAGEGEPPCPEGTRSADGECHPSQGEGVAGEGEGEGVAGEGEGEPLPGEGEGELIPGLCPRPLTSAQFDPAQRRGYRMCGRPATSLNGWLTTAPGDAGDGVAEFRLLGAVPNPARTHETLSGAGYRLR